MTLTGVPGHATNVSRRFDGVVVGVQCSCGWARAAATSRQITDAVLDHVKFVVMMQGAGHG